MFIRCIMKKLRNDDAMSLEDIKAETNMPEEVERQPSYFETK